jgi:hypothetical protein
MYRSLDLSHNSHLQHLKLAIHCESVHLAFARWILSRVDSPQISEVEMSFCCVHQTPQNRRDWEELDDLLTEPRYSSLTKVIVRTTAMLIEEILPRCHTRGILQRQTVLNGSLSQL